MKLQDSFILLFSGLAIWVMGTIYYAHRGATVLESGNLHYWIAFSMSPVVSSILCVAILRWRHIPAHAWASGMLLLALPGMVGEAIVLSHFSTFMPRLQETSAGRYGAFLFATYAVALGIAEIVTLKATP